METISTGPRHHFFGVQNVLVMYYVAAPPADALREREAWVIRTLESFESVALLVVVDKHATGVLPDAEFRAVSKEQGLKYRDFIACSAVVLETDSVWSGLLRSFLRTLSMLIRPPFPIEYFDAVKDAAPFAIESCNSPCDTQELVAALESVRMPPPGES
ncbi:MAG: hypothetical protein AB8H86_05735 [Polyangiales bacterium]